jgi:hypothetical protein
MTTAARDSSAPKPAWHQTQLATHQAQHHSPRAHASTSRLPARNRLANAEWAIREGAWAVLDADWYREEPAQARHARGRLLHLVHAAADLACRAAAQCECAMPRSRFIARTSSAVNKPIVAIRSAKRIALRRR